MRGPTSSGTLVRVEEALRDTEAFMVDALLAIANDRGCAPDDLAAPLVESIRTALLGAYYAGTQYEIPTVKTMIPEQLINDSKKP